MLWPPPSDTYFYCRGTLVESVPGEQGSFAHAAGHARDVAIRTRLRKRHCLHLALDLDLGDSRLGLAVPGLTRLPLLHPFRHDGGSAKYRVVADDAIELLEIDRPILADWPYEDYPDRFAPQPFDLKEPKPCTFPDFAGTTMQGIEAEHAERFIVILPDRKIDGRHGAWSPDGGECVNAIFTFDPATRIVDTFNETD